MNILVDEKSNPVKITISGAFDAIGNRDAREAFNALLEKGHDNFLIDFTDVDFIDSSGLGTLVGFFKKIRIGNGSLELVGLREEIMKIFQLTKLDTVFTIR